MYNVVHCGAPQSWTVCVLKSVSVGVQVVWSLSATAICATSCHQHHRHKFHHHRQCQYHPYHAHHHQQMKQNLDRQTICLKLREWSLNPPIVTLSSVQDPRLLQFYSVTVFTAPSAWFSNAQFFSILGIPLPDPPQLEKQHAIMIRNMIIRIFYLELFQSGNPKIENNHHIH